MSSGPSLPLMRASTIRLIVIGGVIVAILVGTLIATNVEGAGMPKAEYERTVRALYGRVQEAFVATNVDDPSLLDERVAAAQDELRAVADELDELDPPRDVTAENDLLADAMRDYADDLEPLREAAARGDEAAVAAFNERVATNDAVRRMTAAGERMKEKGYDVGALAED